MEVVRIGKERLGEASDVLARAFQDDPAWVWLLPDTERRARLLPWLWGGVRRPLGKQTLSRVRLGER